MSESNPPAEEPEGYHARPGWIKARPENNDFYVEQFKDHPWYPIIKETHERLNELIPGYNISQIKEKFGGLRYYFSYPDPIPVKPEWPAYSTPEKIQNMADRIVEFAEGWVAGFEAAKTSTVFR